MGLSSYAQPVAYADEGTRSAYLRRVATYTAGGISIAGVAGAFSAVAIAPAVLGMGWLAQMAVIFGSMYVAQSVARGMVYGGNKTAGFVLGNAAMGVALGFVLFMAVVIGTQSGNPFGLIAQAGGYTMLTAFTMCVYLWSGPKDLSMVRAGLSVMMIPMLILMVLSFVFPIGGVMGMGLSALFIVVSGGSLLYSLNQILHNMGSNMYVEGAYELSLGLIVLFWNILTLLMRLQGRD